MRYAFVARERTRYPLRMLCRVLGVSISGLARGGVEEYRKVFGKDPK